MRDQLLLLLGFSEGEMGSGEEGETAGGLAVSLMQELSVFPRDGIFSRFTMGTNKHKFSFGPFEGTSNCSTLLLGLCSFSLEDLVPWLEVTAV